MNFLKATLYSLAYIFILSSVGNLKYELIPEKFYDRNLFFFHSIDAIIIGILLLAHQFIIKKPYLLIKSTKGIYYLTAILFGLFIIFIQVPLTEIYNFLFSTKFRIDYNLVSFIEIPILKWKILSTVFLFPIIEEAFFRGFIQKNLQAKYSLILSILLSTFLFSLIHIEYFDVFLKKDYSSLLHFYTAFFGGLVSGLLYNKSKSLGPSIVFHQTWNFSSTLL